MCSVGMRSTWNDVVTAGWFTWVAKASAVSTRPCSSAAGPEDGLAGYLEDLLHEEGAPGTTVQRIR